MPQRDTVAGEATARSATSKIMFMEGLIEMISPAKWEEMSYDWIGRCRTGWGEVS